MANENRNLEKLILGMSLVSTAVENKQDVLQYFVPLAMRAIADLCTDPGTNQLTSEQIRDHISNTYSITIPLNTIETLLRKVARRYKFKVFERGKSIEVPGVAKTEESETLNTRLRRFNKLAESFTVFSKERGIIISENEAKEIFASLFRSNSIALAGFVLEPDINRDFDLKIDIPRALEKPIVEFLKSVRHKDEELFGVLRDIFLTSSLIAILESSQNIQEPPALKQKSRIYLDTNFLLRLLDWQTDYEKMAAQELFDVLKSHEAELYVFSFTLQELVGVLDRFGSEAFKVLDSSVSDKLQDTDLNGVASALRRRKMLRIDFLKALENIENDIRHLGIGVIETAKVSDLRLDKSEVDRLVEYKMQSPYKTGIAKEVIENEARYDIAAVTSVRKARKGRIYKFSDARIWFLTCDYRLVWSNRELHTPDRTIPEAIVDHSMTNLLWVASPQRIGAAGIDRFISHIALDTTFNRRFLLHMDSFIKRYVKENPKDLRYANDIYRSLQIDENRGEWLEVQHDPNIDHWDSVIEQKIREAIKEKKEKEELERKKYGALDSLYEDLKEATEKSIRRFEEENRRLEYQMDRIMNDRRNSRENEKELLEKLRLRTAWIFFIAALFLSIMSVGVLAILKAASFWWICPAVPLVVFYMYLKHKKPSLKSRFFSAFVFWGTATYILLTLIQFLLTKPWE